MTTKKKQAGQVYFNVSDYRKIKIAAQSHNLSFAEFMRQAALEKLKKEQIKERKIKHLDINPFDWKSDKPNDGAENHDKYIYENSKS